MLVFWAEVETFSLFQSSPQPKDLIFQKEREHNTSCEHSEAIFTRLCVQMDLLDLLINMHFGDTSWTDEKFPMACWSRSLSPIYQRERDGFPHQLPSASILAVPPSPLLRATDGSCDYHCTAS